MIWGKPQNLRKNLVNLTYLNISICSEYVKSAFSILALSHFMLLNQNSCVQISFMIQHIYRSGSHTLAKKYIKCFHRTDLTLTVHNHLPLACAGGRGYGNCSVMHFDPDVAHMHHYRSTWYYWYQDYHDIGSNIDKYQY
jgi:hypothetical protein